MEKALAARSAASSLSQVSSLPLPGECENVAAGQASRAQREGIGAPGLWSALASQSCTFLIESKLENASAPQQVLLGWELCSCPARKWCDTVQELWGPLYIEGRGSRGQKLGLVLYFIRTTAPQIRLLKVEHDFWSWHPTARPKMGSPRWDQGVSTRVKVFICIRLQTYVE